jgi:hypothetical protein
MLEGRRRPNGEEGMTLTLSRTRGGTARRAAALALSAAARRTRTGDRPRDDILLDASPVIADPEPARIDMVDEWGMQSFPASDPPSNW